MYKKQKKIFLITWLLVITMSISTMAASDVTSSMKKNKGIKQLVRRTNLYLDGYVLEGLSLLQEKNSSESKIASKSIAITLDNWMKWNIVAQSLRASNAFPASAARTKKEYINLFGGKPNIKAIPSMKRFVKMRTHSNTGSEKYIIYKRAGKYNYGGGDYGEQLPLHKIKNITKIKAGTYAVTYKSSLENPYNHFTATGIYDLGEVTLKIKKSSKSDYNYIIKSITVTCY